MTIDEYDYYDDYDDYDSNSDDDDVEGENRFDLPRRW